LAWSAGAASDFGSVFAAARSASSSLLASVERSLELKRDLPGKDGAWADATWKEYERTGDERRLAELLEYNREDVFMLRLVQEALGIK
jgi:uncharacterized protein YprB with RNaseH-like and TPR domain